MLEPAELYTVEADTPALDRPVLVQALTGFVDAGSATRLARDHLLGDDSQVVATFDVDQLLDYRARRPSMTFIEDHWESYDDPQLALHLLHDPAGTPYLVLAGPEPDVQWERFIAAVRQLIERFDVRLTVGLNAIPMAVPHTRPVGVTAHATRPELVAGYEPWLQTVKVPSSAGHLLEYRLGQDGRDAMGFAVHVPHYVSESEYPAAAEVLLDSVARATGLVLPTGPLRTAATQTRAAIDEQVGQSAEVGTVVQALENQYDAFVGARGQNLLTDDPGGLPSGDELGAELERFLAEQRRHGDSPDR